MDDTENNSMSEENEKETGENETADALNEDKSEENEKHDIDFPTTGFDGLISASKILGNALSTYYSLPWSNLIDSIKTVANVITRITNQTDFEAFASSFSAIQQKISAVVSSISIPSISEERKQELLEAHRLWGKYGWTVYPDSRYENLFDKRPLDKKDADKKALQCCKDIDALFQAINSYNRVKKSDFNEAVCDFKDRHYKSCALILFSLIDAQLIRFQRKQETQGERRSVGTLAIKKAGQRIGLDETQKPLFSALYYANLFSCLYKVFENGNDFKKQPDIINRNFLDHGMLTKPVRKKDCLQLFLLYYNVLEMLEIEYNSGKMLS